MCEDRAKSYEKTGAGSATNQVSADAIPSRGDFSPGLGAAMAGDGYGIAGAASERLSPVSTRSRQQVVHQTIMRKQEQRHALDQDIRDLRRLLDLTSRPDFDAMVDFLTLGAKHGIF